MIELTPLKNCSGESASGKSGSTLNELKSSIFTWNYMAFLYWFSVANSLITFFVSIFNQWADWATEDGSRLVSLFGILLALTVFFGPSAGLLIDFVTKKSTMKGPEKSKRLLGCTICICLNILFGVIVCILNTFQSFETAIRTGQN